MQQEDYVQAASLRDQLKQHPDNVSKRRREELTKELQNAVATEDFQVCFHDHVYAGSQEGTLQSHRAGPLWVSLCDGITYMQAAVSLQSELDSLGHDPASETSSDISLEVKHTSSAITRGVEVQATRYAS